MCPNAQKTAADLMAAIEPTLKLLIQFSGIDGTTIFAEYDAALAAVKAWTPGTSSEEVLQILTDLDTAFNALPVPDSYKDLANIILAGIATVIGVIQANSPAPAAPVDATAVPELAQAHFQADVAASTAAKVTLLVPGFKRSIWHTPESQYKSAWNKQVDASGLDAGLKVA